MDVAVSEGASFAEVVWAWTVAFLPRLGGALLILIVAVLVARYGARGAVRLMDRTSRIDSTLKPVLGAVIRYGVVIIAIVAMLGQLGVQTASLLAALGGAALAIGLALQGTLANIAAGIMLLWLRPLRVGEFIDNGEVAGTVREIGLFATRLDTFDGNYRFVPNSLIWAKPLINYTRNPNRMTNLLFRLPYDADVENALRLLTGLLKSDHRVLKEPAPEVIIDELGENAITIAVRGWVPNAVFWPTNRDLARQAKSLLLANGIEIAYPQRTVHIVQAPAEIAGSRAGRDTHVTTDIPLEPDEPTAPSTRG